jgi:hypothetical protein
MITYWIFYFITGILDGLVLPIQNLPNASLPGGLSSWLSETGGYIALATKIAPLTIAALFVVLTMVVVVENTDGIFKVVKWIYTKIPGIS